MMHTVQRFSMVGKDIRIMSHVTGLIRLSRWGHAGTDKDRLVTLDLKHGDNLHLDTSISNAWTLGHDDYSTFCWFNTQREYLLGGEELMSFQTRKPFTTKIVRATDIECHIYCDGMVHADELRTGPPRGSRATWDTIPKIDRTPAA